MRQLWQQMPHGDLLPPTIRRHIEAAQQPARRCSTICLGYAVS
jgi:hypothetical protein